MIGHNILILKGSGGLIRAALEFASTAHEGQLRKYTNEPYIVHPIAVAELVSQYHQDSEMICAALLHDTIEDTSVTYDKIVDYGFREPIANLVLELTDISKPEDGNRAIRKCIDRMHSANASARGQTIKLADLIDNSTTIFKYDQGFSKVFFEEMRALLCYLADGDRELWYVADKICKEYEKQIEENKK